jgi:hypothetical protein
MVKSLGTGTCLAFEEDKRDKTTKEEMKLGTKRDKTTKEEIKLGTTPTPGMQIWDRQVKHQGHGV